MAPCLGILGQNAGLTGALGFRAGYRNSKRGYVGVLVSTCWHLGKDSY